MSDNQQQSKKKVKNVLNYDPLAWLDEGEVEEEDEGKEDETDIPETSSLKKAVSKKTVSKKAASGNLVANKKVVRKKVVKKKPVRKTAASTEQNLQQENPTVNSSQERDDMSTSNEDNPAYGFFNSTDASVDQNSAAIQENSESGAYGFFNDDVEPNKTVVEAEQGFGFFDTSDQLSSQSIQQDSTTNIINLGAELTIRSVAACKQIINENIVNGFDIKLAAVDLQKIDTAGIQLLYSLHKTLEKTSQTINWVNSNSIINDTCQLLGLPKLLETTEDEGSFGFF